MGNPGSSSSVADKAQHDSEVEALADGESTINHNITKVEEVDLSAYHFTEEESRRVVRKLDWHVCILVLCFSCPNANPVLSDFTGHLV